MRVVVADAAAVALASATARCISPPQVFLTNYNKYVWQVVTNKLLHLKINYKGDERERSGLL
ncbi:hypothetical protein Phum_PHUM266300 [Pediculus humanus corporis]|uniref:Uncharacterized protein n=1 Tax=Pediculus humanus subsp. corporis TaxID=121224 RepID=E0VKK2_PEDHC|nr:uncharacterized protein Phum_PHUM266300 [Pediculus humanus corporis]EEB13908.1 hypothetical protein Phum_PHUM266300 [Pediculus humanus corporis]